MNPKLASSSIALALAVLLSAAASAHEATVHVTQPFVRATVPQQQATGAFMTLRAAHDAKLVAASSPLAGQVEIHEVSMDGDVMKMRQIPVLDLPAGQPVVLAPGGYHLMLLDLKQQLQPRHTVPLTLTIDLGDGQRKDFRVDAPVQALGGVASPQDGGAHSQPDGHTH